MKLLIFIGLFLTLPAFGIAPTSEFGLGKDYSPNREISSSEMSQLGQNDIIDNAEFVRVESDLSLIFRIPLLSNKQMEWKVYPTGFPVVSTEARNSCERNYALSLQRRMEQILTNTDSVKLVELHRYHQNNGIKAWIYAGDSKLNKQVNLKVLESCWQQREVANQQ